jgi:AcrR family transcriptional regulator
MKLSELKVGKEAIVKAVVGENKTIKRKLRDMGIIRGEKIKVEALKLFSENGYYQSSVRMIAQKVGIRESAIYNHFPSKKAIFLELINDGQERANASTFVNDELLEKLDNPEKFFDLFAEKIIDLWTTLEERMFTKMMIQAKFNASVDFDLTLNDLFSSISEVLEIVFEQLSNYDYIKPYDKELLTEQFLAPLIVLKFRFLINNFFDKEQVLAYAKKHIRFFWENVKK